jgi:hypothetical protein
MMPFKKCILLTSMISLGLSGCAYHEKKDRGETDYGRGHGVSVQFNKNNELVLVGKDGEPLGVCGDGDRNTCLLFKENSTLVDFETITIIKFKHKVNPDCVTWSVTIGGKTKLLYDRNDPNCAKYNTASN